MQWALQHNPELAVQRQQHGIAAAEVVIARTYPFNPQLDTKVRRTVGPASAGITNILSQEHKILLEVETRHQGKYRRQAAEAALSRTEWEIAARELEVSTRVIRTFNALLYREEKLRLLDETVRVLEASIKQQQQLVNQGKFRAADVMVTRTDLADVQAQRGMARVALLAARQELFRTLGAVDQPLTLEGTMDTRLLPEDAAGLIQAAEQHRPDLQARRLAIDEADARLRLTVANRAGNVTIGPDVEYDEARATNIGVQVVIPLPILNRHQGEIAQKEAEKTRAHLELQQAELAVQQDVSAAVARQKEVSGWVNLFQTQVLPVLRSSLTDSEKLLGREDSGVDLLRVLDLRRKLLKGQDGYLDAVWELKQVQADLAAAVGDPVLALPGH
jgi:cobalt-zinc-cadmium efflux system outer membrane protein